MVELADSLDSGSSAHSGRAGSSPASRTISKTVIRTDDRFFLSLFSKVFFMRTVLLSVAHFLQKAEMVGLSVFISQNCDVLFREMTSRYLPTDASR